MAIHSKLSSLQSSLNCLGIAEEAVQVFGAGADQPAQVREVRGHGQPHLPQRRLRLLEPQDSLPGKPPENENKFVKLRIF